MKRLFAIASAVCLVFGLTTAAMADFEIEVKSNSEPITMAQDACEKFGNLTFTADSGTILQSGDWWTADLPQGVTLCHAIDFAFGMTPNLPLPGGGGVNGSYMSSLADDGGSTTWGFVTVMDEVAGDGPIGSVNIGGTASAANGMWFLVTGVSGSSRVTISVMDSDSANAASPLCTDGSASINIGNGAAMQIKLFDSNLQLTFGWNDTDNDNIYGEVGDALGGGGTTPWDNSYCGSAFGWGAQTVNVSINSGGFSGNNFLTFNPSNPQVAHLIAATVIQLDMCKADEYGFVSLAGGQNAACAFDYEMAGGIPGGYCPDIAGSGASFTGSVIGGNKVLISNTSGTFYNAGDTYKVVLTTSGNGLWWAGAGATVGWYAQADNTYCNQGGLSLTATPTLTAFTVTDPTAPGPGATGAGCGSIASNNQFRVLTSASFGGINTSDMLEVNLAGMVFDPAQFSDGDQGVVTVQLVRDPCGVVFTDTRTVCEFVTACGAAAPVTTLLFPYSTNLDGSDGWWFGMSFCNPVAIAGAAAGPGTAVITVYEDDGDVGSYTTASINNGDMMTYSGPELLTLITQTGGTGTLGDARAHILVVCGFVGAGGFGMMGNGADSTGYVAYGNSATWGY